MSIKNYPLNKNQYNLILKALGEAPLTNNETGVKPAELIQHLKQHHDRSHTQTPKHS